MLSATQEVTSVCTHSVVSQHFMELEGSLPRTQELSTCTYPEPDQFSRQHSILSLHLNVILLHLGLPSILFPIGSPTNNIRTLFFLIYNKTKQNKTIPVTGRGRLKFCEMFRIPHYLDSWITHYGEFVTLTHRPHSTPLKIFSSLLLVLISVRD
jgi:hypothetical protein